MGRSKQPTGYPTIYSRIIQSVSESGKEFCHVCKTKQEAAQLRFSFYDYFKSLRHSTTAFDNQLFTQSQGLMLCVRENYLIIKARDTVEQALALGDSLEQYEQPDILTKPTPRVSEQYQVVTGTNTEIKKIEPNEKPSPSHDDVISQYLKGDKKS